jgi:hypothetical protein
MINIYFAPTPWSTSPQVLEDYRFQTPNNLGQWEDIRAVLNPNDAEYLIIQDETNNIELLNKFEPKKRLYFNREALSVGILNNINKSDYNLFSFWNGSGYLPVRWWYGTNIQASEQGYGGISKTYDELNNLEPIEKTKNICCILSNKTQNEGHRLRKTFTEKYLEKYNLDLFGSVSFRNSNIPNNDKFSALKDYKYCLGFDNQDFIDDFIGTQFTDSILSFTVPIFWCGTDLSKYYPKGSFIQFNARDFNEIDRIKEIISKDDYYKRLPALKEARDMILNKYNFWPTIKKIIDTNGK